MALELRWVGEAELDQVALARMQSFKTAGRDLEVYQQLLRDDRRAAPGDFLLAYEDGNPVGTTTSLSMTMWLRGKPLPCQGVAWVGTIKTHRRGGSGGARGIASQLMDATLAMARRRGQVVSALMPFRASFYQHFGYGLVERQNEWTIPTRILPAGAFDGFRFIKDGDLPLVQACRRRMVERGQCDIERTAGGWSYAEKQWGDGFSVVDVDPAGGAVRSWLYLAEHPNIEERVIRVADMAYDSIESFARILRFLASLRDQFAAVSMVLPVDLPLNRLLAEPQLKHRPVSHATAIHKPMTRMQVRILDHVAFLSGMRLESNASGRATLAIHECEGATPKISIEIDAGAVKASAATGQADVESADHVWASIACGDLPASKAAELGLIQLRNPAVLGVLDAFASGPAPFCNEYF